MRKSLLLISFVVYHIGKTGAQEWRCDYIFHEESGGWLKFHENPMTWEEARLTCLYEGSQLASPTPGLLNALKNIIQTNSIPSSKVFTGIHSTFSRMHFTSIEGTPLSKIPHEWAQGEPNNLHNQENCIALNQRGHLEDIGCNTSLPFICYKKEEGQQLNACGTLDNEYTLDLRTGSCYKFHRHPHSWERAVMICQAEGGYLAIINSETEAQVIRDVFDRNPKQSMSKLTYPDYIFLGFRDLAEHNTWVTVQGQTIKDAGYEKFAEAEGFPGSDNDGRHCGGALRNALLTDFFCNAFVPFICEKDPKSLRCSD